MSDINGFAAADFPDDARTPVGDDLPGQETDAEAIFRERLEEQRRRGRRQEAVAPAPQHLKPSPSWRGLRCASAGSFGMDRGSN
jgi:hypothetical protein